MTDLDKAVERLTKALDIATKYTGGMMFGERDDGFLSFADLRTLLTALSAKDAELAKAREALDLALDYLGELEPGDSRAVSNEYVAMLGVLSGAEPNNPGEDLEIIRAAKKARTARQALGADQ